MRRFYVEEDDNGKEIKRKLTTFANDDLTQLSDDELETLYYESSAQFLAKAMHFVKIENELFSRKNVTVSDEILINTGNNIIEAINQVSKTINAETVFCHSKKLGIVSNKKFGERSGKVAFFILFFSNDWFVDSVSLHETNINRRTFPIEVLKVFASCFFISFANDCQLVWM